MIIKLSDHVAACVSEPARSASSTCAPDSLRQLQQCVEDLKVRKMSSRERRRRPVRPVANEGTPVCVSFSVRKVIRRCMNVMATGHRAMIVKMPTKGLIHIAEPVMLS